MEGTRAASGRWAGRKSLPGRRAPKGGTGEAAARARSRIRRLVELVVKRPGCRRGRDQRHVTLAGIGVLPQIHGDLRRRAFGTRDAHRSRSVEGRRRVGLQRFVSPEAQRGGADRAIRAHRCRYAEHRRRSRGARRHGQRQRNRDRG